MRTILPGALLKRLTGGFLTLLLLSQCATIQKPTPSKPLSTEEKERVISSIEIQDKKVSSFYSIGSLLVKNWLHKSESDILIVGSKNPLKMKIEVTHSWGQPIVHILMTRERLEILSFPEKKLYTGVFTPDALSKFFPGDLDIRMIWATLRGYPNLIGHQSIVSLKGNQVSLLNREGKVVEIIDLDPETLKPRSVSFPEQQVELIYSKFQDKGGISYAEEVEMKSRKQGGHLVLKHRKMVFNRSIPKKIFSIQKPPSFDTVPLKD